MLAPWGRCREDAFPAPGLRTQNQDYLSYSGKAWVFLYTLGLDNRDLFLRAANRSLFIALRRNRNMSQKRPAAGVEGAVTESSVKQQPGTAGWNRLGGAATESSKQQQIGTALLPARGRKNH